MTAETEIYAAARKKLIFALDVSTIAEADELISLLGDSVGMFKVGKQLFMSSGPQVIQHVTDRGSEVFLDLKFHDIPRTVARASMEATRLGVSIFNLHASGSAAMMHEAVRSVDRVCRTEKLARPRMLAVTVLTSIDIGDLRSIGIDSELDDQVVRLALLARDSGMDGVVASPREIGAIRDVCGRDFIVLTPGIRPAGSEQGDQKRTAGPAEAIRRGADYVVVGRPIRDAPDPRSAANQVVEEIVEGLS